MRLHPGNGIWEIFIPGIGTGAKYKFEMLNKDGYLLPLKNDPYGHYHEPPPGNASIVFESTHRWEDSKWMKKRTAEPELDGPISIYEVHLGSWRRKPDGSFLTYAELAMLAWFSGCVARPVPTADGVLRWADIKKEYRPLHAH